MDAVDQRARQILQLVQQANRCEVSEEETSRDTPEDRELLRRLASESIVLLKNEQAVLPWRDVDSIGVIGVHANIAAYCGGNPSQPHSFLFL